jgi:hypothetical protein
MEGSYMTKSCWRVLLAVFGVVSMCGVSAAQLSSGNRQPISKPGGYASAELQTIYNQAIGTGYTANSLNAITLNNALFRNQGLNTANRAGGGPRIGMGLGPSVAGKPFASFSPAPTVSPYLNLFRTDLEGGSDMNYNTLVRPMLQQQQFNQQIQRQSLEFARRLQSISAQSDFNPRGSESQYPTGHQTVYRYYGRFYPALNYRR